MTMNMNYRVTAVAVITKGDKVLLGRKPKDVGPYPNTWIIPGGGIHLGQETTEEALIREIHEETGIEIVDIAPLMFSTDTEPDKHGIPTYFIHLVYTAKYKSGEVHAQDDVARLQWIPISDIPKITVARPSVLTFRTLGWLP
jgi:8-oxo-dGTP diphosphatase